MRTRLVSSLVAIAAALVIGFLLGRVSQRRPGHGRAVQQADRTPAEAKQESEPTQDAAGGSALEASKAAPPAAEHQQPRNPPPLERSTEADASLVASLLNELGEDRARSAQAMRRLALLGTEEALDGLLKAFAHDRVPLKGMGTVWAEVLLAFDDPRVGTAVRDVLARRVAERQAAPPEDLAALWGVAARVLGADAEPFIFKHLTDDSLPGNSVFRVSLLDGISGDFGPQITQAIAEHLRDPDAAVSAFRALLRMDDEAARRATMDHLLNLGNHAVVASQYFGQQASADDIGKLRQLSNSGFEHAAVYAVAVANAPSDLVRQEAASLRTAIRSLLSETTEAAGAPERLCRRWTADAIANIAEEIAAPDLVLLLRGEAARSTVGRERLLEAARVMELALRDRE